MTRLGQIVPLLNFLAANQGVTLRDTARATGLQPQEICAMLDALTLCGLPPYAPHDYIGYRLLGRGDDAVIDLQYARHFARPLAFTPEETLALKYAMEHFARAADETSLAELQELAGVLANALQGRARQILSGRSGGFVVPRQTRRMRALIGTLSEAIDGRWVVNLEYYSAHRGRLGTRRVCPFQIIEAGAYLYLYAWCELAGATRHFRLERIRAAELTDTRHARRPPARRQAGRMAGIFEGRPRDQLVVRFSPEAGPDVCDEWTNNPDTTLRMLAGGAVELTLPLYNPQWAAGFVLSFGEHARIISPQWLRAEVIQAARAGIAAHR
ncbi:MAG: WYL domain-containing protein [Planctomycetes bacterium]|nr:WYL domain-containing protein [Planctomycetota bacterium]MCL4729326.1 WYL domain-containing protein [Planctomycetota bacterium]